MTKKVIFTITLFLVVFNAVFASEPLDSALIASKLKRFEMFNPEFQYDSILYVTNSGQADSVVSIKIDIVFQSKERIEGNGFDKNKENNLWEKKYKILAAFDVDGNILSQINIDNDSISGKRTDFNLNKYGLRVNSTSHRYQNNTWIQGNSVLFEYDLLNDTIIVSISDESKLKYYNDTILTLYNFTGEWITYSKQVFDFNEDGSINSMLLASPFENNVDKFQFYYKINTGVAKTNILSNYSFRNKHLFIKSEIDEKLKIYNISGNLVAIKNNISGENIHDLSFLAPGVYVLKTESGRSGKVVVK